MIWPLFFFIDVRTFISRRGNDGNVCAINAAQYLPENRLRCKIRIFFLFNTISWLS